MASPNLVYVIDDDEAVRMSLQFLLKSAQIDARPFESANAFLAELPDAEFGCIITDVRMPGISGVDLLKQLRQRGVHFPVIVITGHGDVQLAVEAMKAGAFDFFEKPFDDEALLSSLKSALGQAQQDAQREAGRAQLLEKLNSLSNREREVLEGLVAGKPNKIIAFDLSISPRTIEIYRANVMTKMGARSLSDLVRMALAAGVLNKTT